MRDMAQGRLRWQASSTRSPAYQLVMVNARPCRSRLAGEGVFICAAWLKAAFAGKPAPTRSPAYRLIMVNARPCRSRLAGESVFICAAWLQAAFAGKPAPTRSPAYRLMMVNARPCRSRLAGESVFICAAWLQAVHARTAASSTRRPVDHCLPTTAANNGAACSSVNAAWTSIFMRSFHCSTHF
ncbi:hypothetical protein PS928_05505 [Pseudomonas fluorescens]|uniref:Uncharacterized protein n=1 Tax=Pseudomonas fluorescens TaxID=294 RepID=A0A5E7VKL1_PSEFL|nr:hypothetical protein PS928_05505 [Pseudomonas fluorescens]